MQKLSESKKIWESYGMPKSSTPAFQCIFEELGDGFSIKKEEYGVRIDYPKIVTFLISHPDIE